MTSYLRRGPGAKKAEALGRAETALRDAISRGDASKAIAKLADRVRDAKLGYLKARLFEARGDFSRDAPSQQVSNLESEQAAWSTLSVDDVIDRYR